jgi:osmotically-inducible protein OsmY
VQEPDGGFTVKRIFNTLAVCVMFAGIGPLQALAAQDRPPAQDNTKINKENGPTADQAGNRRPDRELMQNIRKSITDDSSLSTYAHNVKVIAKNCKVTLRGPVTSEDEKRSVEQKANDVAGAGNVSSEITIKAARVKKN